jgi:hypothetical protein
MADVEHKQQPQLERLVERDGGDGGDDARAEAVGHAEAAAGRKIGVAPANAGTPGVSAIVLIASPVSFGFEGSSIIVFEHLDRGSRRSPGRQ